MEGIIEKIIVYVIGGISGLAFGFILLSFRIQYLDFASDESFIIVMALVGIIISLGFLEHRKEKTYKANQKIWNEEIALVAHEMRTSLTSTNWAIQITIQKYGDKMSVEDRKMLDGIVDSISTTVMHSVNLLDVSLLDIGKLSISFQRMPLSSVGKTLGEIVEKFSIGANSAGITMNSSIKLGQNKEIEIDLKRFRIILENLLENSIQYTFGAKKEIEVTITNDNKFLNIIVRDTGMGIPEREQAKIFSEFFRASNARKRLSSGSGIGLHMCEQYVKAHHGTISFESRENEGTTFFVAIPLKTVADVNEFLTKI